MVSFILSSKEYHKRRRRKSRLCSDDDGGRTAAVLAGPIIASKRQYTDPFGYPVGFRRYWGLVLLPEYGQVEGILNRLGLL